MANGIDLSDADYTALADFRFALRRFLVFSERRAADFGLTPQQHQAMLAIRGALQENISVGYVAARLALKPHSATGLIDRLEALGMVARRSSPADRRQALLSLTPRALVLLQQLSATHREEIVRLGPLLTELLERLN